MDFLSLYISGRILHFQMSKRRLVCSSIIGGIYGVVSLLIKGTLPYIALNISVYLLMCFTAYKNIVLSQYVKLCILFYSVSLLMGGAVSASYTFFDGIISDISISDSLVQGRKIPFYIFIITVIVCASLAYITSRIFTQNKDIKDAYITAVLGEKRIDMHLLIDSGNLLHDPLSGEPVILISDKKFEKLTGCIGKTLLNSERLISKLRCIPAQSASGNMMLYGIIPDELYVGTKTEKVPFRAVIAVCDGTDFAEFDGVIPICLYEISPSKQ